MQMHEDDVPTLGIMRLAEQGAPSTSGGRPLRISTPQKMVKRGDTSNTCSG